MDQVVWTAFALANIDAIRTYIAQFNPRTATELAECLITAGDSLHHFPHRDRRVPGTTMRELLSVTPYVIRYRITGNTVTILRVRHGARRPTKP